MTRLVRSELVTLVAVAAFAAASPAAAQSASLHLGAMSSADGDKESVARLYGLRADHAIGRWLLVEAGVSYSPVELTRFGGGPSGTPVRTYAAPRRTADAQVQLQLPLSWFRPYAAAGVGSFWYRRLPDADGRRELLRGSTRFGALGLRLDLARHVGMRGEIRVRGDRPAFGYFPIDVEPSLGMFVRW